MLSKQSSKINEASVVFVGSNDKVRFLDDSTRLESDDSMASLEEGQEATESEVLLCFLEKCTNVNKVYNDSYSSSSSKFLQVQGGGRLVARA